MKKITYISIFLLLALSIFAGGCRKDNPVSLQGEDRRVSTSSANYWELLFVDFWEVMNQSYVLWLEEKELDWDDIYDEYRPRFAELDEMKLNDSESYNRVSGLYNVSYAEYFIYGDSLGLMTFKEITSQLKDCHYLLTFNDFNAYIGGGQYEVYKRDYYHASDYSGFNSGLDKTIEAGLSDGSITNYCAGIYECYETGREPLCLYSYCQDGDIAYFRLSSWYMLNSSNEPLDSDDNSIDEVLDNFYNIVRNTPNLKGAIIDVRNNLGGYNADMKRIVSPFLNINDPLTIGYERHKSGPNRLDYTDYVPSLVSGTSEEESLRFPIAVLTDINSTSMSEAMGFTAYAFSDDSIVVGERTFGATCSLADDMHLAGGIVDMPNFYIYTSSVLRYYGEDRGFYEGVGITPDIEVFNDPEWGATTVDVQKQAAIDYLHSL